MLPRPCPWKWLFAQSRYKPLEYWCKSSLRKGCFCYGCHSTSEVLTTRDFAGEGGSLLKSAFQAGLPVSVRPMWPWGEKATSRRTFSLAVSWSWSEPMDGETDFARCIVPSVKHGECLASCTEKKYSKSCKALSYPDDKSHAEHMKHGLCLFS